MSELQNDKAVIEEDNAAIENQENGTDLAPVSEAEHEEQPRVDEEAEAKIANNEAIQKRINKEHFEKQQAKREAAEYKQKLDDYESKQREEMAARVRDIPPMPDAFDDDFEAKVEQRDQALLRKAEFDAQQNYYNQQQQFNQQQAAQAKQLEATKLQNDFTSNAKKLGASDEEFNSVIATLNSQGLTSDTADLIMRIGGDGYLVSKYLAANPLEAQEFINSGLGMQGFKLAGLTQKASALKPKTSNAPSPATNLQGNGVDPEAGKYKYLDGATFE